MFYYNLNSNSSLNSEGVYQNDSKGVLVLGCFCDRVYKS